MEVIEGRELPEDFAAVVKAFDSVAKVEVAQPGLPLRVGVCNPAGELIAREDVHMPLLGKLTSKLSDLGYTALMLGDVREMHGCDVLYGCRHPDGTSDDILCVDNSGRGSAEGVESAMRHLSDKKPKE